MRSAYRRTMSFLTTSTLVLTLGLPAAYAAQVIKIGVTAPLSGPASQSGLALEQGMKAAAADWNKKGGVDLGGQKYKIKLLFEDTQDNPAQGVSIVQKLINQDNVNFVIGDAFSSSVTLAEMDLADQFKMPMMSCEPVSSEIPKKIEKNPGKYKYFWKADFSSNGYADTVYETYKDLIKAGKFKPRNKKVAFIVENTDYGRSIAKLTGNLFKKDGWTVVSTDTVQLGNTRFTSILTKLSYRKPSILVSVFTSTDSGVALSRQFEHLGLSASQFAVYYPTRPGYLKGAGQSAEGLMWTPILFNPSLFPQQKSLNEQVKKRFGIPATSDHGYGYDCVNIAVNAYKHAGSTDPAKVVEALAKTDYKGVLGRYVFGQKTHTAKFGAKYIPIPAAQIRDGHNVIIWPHTVATGKYEKQSWLP